MAPHRRATSTRGCHVRGRSDQFRVETQHFLDVRGMRIERLDESLAREDERLVKSVEMMHDAFAQASFRIAQTNHGSGPDVASGNAARIGYGVSLSHERSIQRALVALIVM